MFAVSIQNVSKKYQHNSQSRWVLNQVSLELSAGSKLGIMGQSGAGKSTLIRMLNGLEKPDEGTIQVNGENLNQLTHQALRTLRQKIGMIFQHYPLVKTKTVYDNVALPLILTHHATAHIEQKVMELLEWMSLADKRYQFPQHLSGGQQQRVAIARALVADPELVLADEMTSALDRETTEDILQLFQCIQQKKKFTLVLVAHDPHVVRTLCEQMAFLKAGRLQLQSPSQQTDPSAVIWADDWHPKGGH